MKAYTETSETVVLYTGQFWGFNIGDSADKVYSTLQSIKTEKLITSFSSDIIIINSASDIKKRPSLYKYMLLGEFSEPTSVAINFEEMKIKSIQYTTQQLLNQWPTTVATANSIRTGDLTDSIYNRLAAISNLPEYADKFKKITFIGKLLDAAYDPAMSFSKYWEFQTNLIDKKKYKLTLNFVNGRLFYIQYILTQYQQI